MSSVLEVDMNALEAHTINPAFTIPLSEIQESCRLPITERHGAYDHIRWPTEHSRIQNTTINTPNCLVTH